jgi:hypothetical protein
MAKANSEAEAKRCQLRGVGVTYFSVNLRHIGLRNFCKHRFFLARKGTAVGATLSSRSYLRSKKRYALCGGHACPSVCDILPVNTPVRHHEIRYTNPLKYEGAGKCDFRENILGGGTNKFIQNFSGSKTFDEGCVDRLRSRIPL